MLAGQVITETKRNLIIEPHVKNGPIFLNSPCPDKPWDTVRKLPGRKLVTETKCNNESLAPMASSPHIRTLHYMTLAGQWIRVICCQRPVLLVHYFGQYTNIWSPLESRQPHPADWHYMAPNKQNSSNNSIVLNFPIEVITSFNICAASWRWYIWSWVKQLNICLVQTPTKLSGTVAHTQFK